jgi:hypothetical protein
MSLRRSQLQGLADGAAVKDRTAARVAWSVWAASCIVLVLSVVLSIQVETVPRYDLKLWTGALHESATYPPA